MAFWSSQTLRRRLGDLVDKPSDAPIDCNAIELRVGAEIYVSPDLEDVFKTTKRLLSNSEPFLIPPGQFAFLLTEEIVTVPATAMAFISMKATFKNKGLVNVSGFHVDPGWRGPLMFAVFNAGPAPVHLQRGLPLFLIWYADLDEESEKRKTQPGSMTIDPAIINNLTGGTNSLNALGERVNKAVKELEAEDKDLSDRIHALSNAQTRNTVTLAILVTLATGLLLFAFRQPLLSCAERIFSQSSSVDSATRPSAPAIKPAAGPAR